ncbi:MAG TPA: FtsX-like permease family protein [Paucimonas sp.]|nr:FtsX-like permease family protein [Paucimonas sp.]
MRLRDFRIGWRFLMQEPAYSLVVVLGLAVGFAACMLLLGFVRHSLQYDAHVPDVDNVYYVKQRFNVHQNEPWFEQAPLILQQVAAAAPGVVEVAVHHRRVPDLMVKLGGSARAMKTAIALPPFPAMVGLKTIDGDVDTTLESPDGLVVTDATARQWFGDVRAVGRVVSAGGKALRIGAVVAAPPAATTMPFEVMHGLRSVTFPPEMAEAVQQHSPHLWFKMLVRVKPGASIDGVAAAMQQAVDNHSLVQNLPPDIRARLGQRKVMDIRLAPLREAYFDQDIARNAGGQSGDRGNRMAVAGLAAIAALILGLAAANYINLATVRVLRRQREIGMRKILGADARQVALQFLAESLLVVMIAAVAGLLLAWWLLPAFAALVARDLESIFSWPHLASVFAAAAAIGLACGIQPARIALRVPATRVLTGRANTETAGGRRVRFGLTVFQFAAAIGLAAATLTIAWQMRHAMHSDPGFDPAPLLALDLHEPVGESARARALIADLRRLPGVAGVTTSLDAVGRHVDLAIQQLRRQGGASTTLEKKIVGREFFDVYGLRPTAGRLFDEKRDGEQEWQKVVVSETAVRMLGFASNEAAVGQLLYNDGDDGKVYERRIIGVVRDIRFDSLREPTQPVFYEPGSNAFVVTLRVSGSIPETERAVEALWARHFSDSVLDLHPASHYLALDYAEDARVGKLLAVSTGIAIAIAAFGMYVLSAYTVQRRTREIVLRKLYGARRRDIAGIVAREFGTLCAVAAIIALPFAGLAIAHYLATFVDRAPHVYWVLAVAPAAGLAVAALAAARNTWIAMRIAPADALRD